MQNHVEKMKIKPGLGERMGKMLRLLRGDMKLSASLIGQEESAHVPAPTQVYHDSQRDTRNVLLYAERKKAQALMEFQRRRFNVY